MNAQEATKYLNAVLIAFEPVEAIEFTQETWAKLHSAISALVNKTEVENSMDIKQSLMRNSLLIDWKYCTNDPITEMDVIFYKYTKTVGQYPDPDEEMSIRNVREMLFTWWAFHRDNIRSALLSKELK